MRTERPASANEILAVASLEPIGGGKNRRVYVHPDNPDLIVKVPGERQIRDLSGHGGRWHKRWFRRLSRLRYLRDFSREFNEQLAERASGERLPPYIQEIIGVVETDLGLGLVCRAVRTAEGELAPHLRALARAGKFDRRARADLDAFFAWALESPIVFSDLNPRNIVYGFVAGKPVFVVVDGIGEKNVIPLSSLSRRLNRRSKQQRIDRINRELEELERGLREGPNANVSPDPGFGARRRAEEPTSAR